MRGVSIVLAALSTVLVLAGCALSKRTAAPTSATKKPASIVAIADVLSMERSTAASYRFYGKVKVVRPERYRGRKVDCFLLSHDQDLSQLKGHRIEVAIDPEALNSELEPHDPFSLINEPHLSAEETGGHFHPIDFWRYAKPVSIRSHISAYIRKTKPPTYYFSFDVASTGDMVTVTIDSPARYRGTQLSILVTDTDRLRESWSKIGTHLAFTADEATLEFEPQGFTFASELKELTFQDRKPDGSPAL